MLEKITVTDGTRLAREYLFAPIFLTFQMALVMKLPPRTDRVPE